MPASGDVVYTLFVRRYAPFKSFGGGFEGDARAFSVNPDDSARTIGTVTFSPRSATVTSLPGKTSGSSWVGPWEVRKRLPFGITLGKIDKQVGQVRAVVSKVAAINNGLTFTLHTEGNLPLKDLMLNQKLADAVDWMNRKVRPDSPSPQGTPDIDTFVDFTVYAVGNQIIFQGTMRGDGFPNAEVFVLDARQQAVALFDYRTRSNELGPLHRLLGTHEDYELGKFRRQVTLNPDGSFGANHKGGPVVVNEK